MNIQNLLKLVNEALDDINATDIIHADVSHKSILCDYFVIASVTSTRQSISFSDKLGEKLKPLNLKILGVEGMNSGDWVLVDIGYIVINIMKPNTRKYYNLEELWVNNLT